MKCLRLLFLLSLACGLLSGCGKSKDDAALIVGTEPTFPPFEMTDDSGQIIGFDIDLIKAVAQAEGLKVEVQNLGFDGLIPALMSGHIDIIASGMTITDERRKQVDFSDPYVNSGLAIAISSDNKTIKSVDDLKSKKVAVQLGSTGSQKAEEMKASGMLAEVVTFNTVDLAIMELLNGGVAAVINDIPATKAYMTQQPGKIVMLPKPLSSESYGFALRQKRPELLKKINEGLEKVKADGTYDKLAAKYFK